MKTLLNSEIEIRYSEESQTDSNLSCGNNLSFLELKQGERVLDLGCGRGLETIEGAKMVGETGEAVGLDITPKMLATAKENAKKQNISNVRFEVGDIENLPFGDNRFDAVMSNCVINHAKDKMKTYLEINRILKDRGRFVVSDAVTKHPLPDSIKNDPQEWANCFGGAITEEEYLNSIKNAGFNEITILKRREYLKNGYAFISLTIKAYK
jgi:SAM-dependent methyltransferase